MKHYLNNPIYVLRFFSKMNNNISIIQGVERETNIRPIPLTDYPDQEWQETKNKFQHRKVTPMPLDTPVYDDKVRFVCLSDTHSLIDRMQYEIPSGDILLHAGDFSSMGKMKEVQKFFEFLGTLNHKFKYKVVIAGNHEISFDSNAFGGRYKQPQDPREFIKNCIYLEDAWIELYGLKIYGSPWQPTFGNWAFNADRGADILKIWNKIPDSVDVLMTHGPPLGFGDQLDRNGHCGCCELLATIRERVRPKYHVFGHIHEDHGMWTDNVTTYINASICNLNYVPCQEPVIFDIQLPEGVTKE